MSGVDGTHCDRCDGAARFLCVCGRCEREPERDEKFATCVQHRPDVIEAHRRVRGAEPRWMDKKP